eukprot:5464670-Alexandrium_andersonii.AAC.1
MLVSAFLLSALSALNGLALARSAKVDVNTGRAKLVFGGWGIARARKHAVPSSATRYVGLRR